MREVFERLESLGIAWFLTGSEALGRYGEPRQTMDIDVVIAVTIGDFDPVRRAFEDDFLVADPIDFSGRVMSSLISMASLGKVDLMLARDDAWSRSEMARRKRWDHPEHGPIWVATLEDLLLAKLEWSGGTSELQLRDCRNLVANNRKSIDWAYLEHWAAALGVRELLGQARDAA